MADQPLLAVRGLHKHFGGVHALRGVDLDIQPGAVHCLIGENGAGKSTLGKILAGVHQPDEGQILLHGQPVHFRSAREALANSIALIAQEIAVVPSRTVAHNVTLGHEPHRWGVVRRGAERRMVEELQRSSGIRLPSQQRVGGLRQADQQKTEILRAVGRDSRVIIMDEPTAALTADEADRLLQTIEDLRGSGKAVILVSHQLDEVLRVADVITILRNGELVRSGPRDAENTDSLVQGMLGRPLEQTFPPKTSPSRAFEPVLTVEEVAAPGVVEPTSFELYRGEILGIVGLVGSGRSELVRAIYGADRPTTGSVSLNGTPIHRRTPRRCVRAGLALLPESRKEQGLLMAASVRINTSLAAVGGLQRWGVLRTQQERRATATALERADTRFASLGTPVRQLSGGNQQKVLFARWLLVEPRALIIDEPTRGVDVGAKVRIHQLIADLAASGMAIVVISSDSDEVFGLAHRVLALRSGRVVGEYDGPYFPRDEVLHRVLV